MLKTQKILSKFLQLFCLGIILISCSVENEIIHNHNNQDLILFQKQHLKDLLTNEKFINNFTNLKKAKYKTRYVDSDRSSIEEAFNFKIVDSIVKVMSDNNNTYYTIQIRTDNNTDNKLENLVLLETTDTETIGYIVKYNTLVTEDKKEQEIINSGFSEVIPITIQSAESSNRVIVITYTYSLCNGIPYNCGGSVCGFATGIMTIEVPDFDDDATSEGGWSPDGGGGGANTGPGDPNDPTGLGTGCKGCGDLVTSPISAEYEEPLDCNITIQQLQQLFPNSTADTRNKLVEMINDVGDDFGINTKSKVCHFLAQTGAETGGFTTLNVQENLNYITINALKKSFYIFKDSNPNSIDATPYLNNPQGLANLVYCCKFGNGNQASGDGWKYRGRGIIQLTWKGNYDAYESYLNSIGLAWTYNNQNDVETVYQHSIASGMWYFKDKVLDKMEINNTTTSNSVTKKINRHADQSSKVIRENYLNLAKTIINCQ